MKLEEIESEWEQDSKIDMLQLDIVSVEIPKLHHKYLKMLARERLLYKKMYTEFKVKEQTRREWWMNGNVTQEDCDKYGWPYTQPRKVLQGNDLKEVMAGDTEMVNDTLSLAYQKEKVDVLEEIIGFINRMNWTIRNAIEWSKYTQGV